MNYRHAYHAGNFADVVKHVALVAILLHLRKKETPFAVIDSHAGRGAYDLAGEEARKTGEAANGIGKLVGLADAPEALTRYLGIATAASPRYPGSPLIAAQLLRPQDRLVAIEKHPEEAALLKQTLALYRKARAEEGDGYAKLASLLPPPERRGLVLIDPPFEAADEFTTLAQRIAAALRRFANGIFLVWYPVKSRSAANAFNGEVLAAGAIRVLRIEIALDAPEGKLDRASLLVLNAPYGFAEQMRECLAMIAPRVNGRATLEILADV